MTAPPPIPCQWDGEKFSPTNPHWHRVADQHFVVGAVYPLEVHEQRSYQSHGHYFAVLHDAWNNLPEDQLERFPTPEHLRKFALIRAGYRDERSIICQSEAEAKRFAVFLRGIDDYAVVLINEKTVTFYTAKSQSKKAMGKAEFQRSKEAVLNVLARMIGTAPETLKANAGQAA